eukprot:13677029-Alexandrium_andersonii.AAC.1
MSASLVGSEMCIRDRFPPRWAGFRALPSRGFPGEGQRLPDPWPSRSVPVSYTHLTLPTICSV